MVLSLAFLVAKELSPDSLLVCDAQIYLALTYHRMKEYRLGLEVVNELLKNKDNLKEGRYVGTLIVKELCMRRLEGAEKSRREAAKWTKLGFWIGLGCIILYVLFVFIMGVSFFGAASQMGR